jgi:acyl carrier protein
MTMATPVTDVQSIKDGLKELIVQRLKLEIAASSIKDDASLFGGADATEGGLSLDSVEALEIVVGIEERWGVVIQDDSVASEFYSIDTLSSLVARLLSENAGKPTPEPEAQSA